MSASITKRKENPEGNDQENDDGTGMLAKGFQRTLELYEELCNSTHPTNDPEFQKKVHDGIVRLEEMTRNVNTLGLFSANETISEVSTENLKYFLLPALLADFSLRNHKFDRIDMLEHAQVYYRDYIQRLNEYGVCDIELDKDKDRDGAQDDTKKEESEIGKIKNDPLISSAIFRESKIRRYNEAKRLEDQLIQLKRLILEQENQGATIDEEVERKFYIALISRWLSRAIEELSSIEQEKPMAKMRSAMLVAERENPGSTSRGPPVKHRSKPLQPIIITRDATQKKVYGIGYPSIPTVTVDEFIDQKVKDGSLAFNDERIYGNSLYSWADDPDKKRQGDEEEEERKEKLAEEDDEVELERKRQWDDWKDDHKRGEGNRHNMG